jgi:hypothetical protein
MALGEGSKVWLSMVGNEHFIEESLGGVKYWMVEMEWVIGEGGRRTWMLYIRQRWGSWIQTEVWRWWNALFSLTLSVLSCYVSESESAGAWEGSCLSLVYTNWLRMEGTSAQVAQVTCNLPN